MKMTVLSVFADTVTTGSIVASIIKLCNNNLKLKNNMGELKFAYADFPQGIGLAKTNSTDRDSVITVHIQKISDNNNEETKDKEILKV